MVWISSLYAWFGLSLCCVYTLLTSRGLMHKSKTGIIQLWLRLALVQFHDPPPPPPPPPHTHTHTLKHSHTQTLSHSLTHTQTQTHSLTHTHSHSHTHTLCDQSPCTALDWPHSNTSSGSLNKDCSLSFVTLNRLMSSFALHQLYLHCLFISLVCTLYLPCALCYFM